MIEKERKKRLILSNVHEKQLWSLKLLFTDKFHKYRRISMQLNPCSTFAIFHFWTVNPCFVSHEIIRYPFQLTSHIIIIYRPATIQAHKLSSFRETNRRSSRTNWSQISVEDRDPNDTATLTLDFLGWEEHLYYRQQTLRFILTWRIVLDNIVSTSSALHVLLIICR